MPRLRRSAILRMLALSLAAPLLLPAAPAAAVYVTKVDFAQSVGVAFRPDDGPSSANATAALRHCLPADGATPIYPFGEPAFGQRRR
jgi:hypothetical protein